MAMMHYGRNIKIPVIPEPKAYSTYNDDPSVTQYEEVYQDYNTMTIRTVGQDREIARLKSELEVKEKKKMEKVKELIAYYYKR